MDKTTAFAILLNIKDDFFSKLLYKNGEQVERNYLQNVDAFIITNECIVFKNTKDQYLLLPSFAGVYFYTDLDAKRVQKKNRKFPTQEEIETNFLDDILKTFVNRDKNILEDDKKALVELIPEFLSSLPTNPENVQKLEIYNKLKQELMEKRIING